MKVIETDRLILRRLKLGDDAFILELLNDPSWLRFIGDKGVRSLEDARQYLLSGPIDMYERLGFGLYLTELKDDQTPIGLCGLIKRPTLEDTDIGFGFLPQFCGQGYAFEAASAVMNYGTNVLGLKRIVAIVSPDNTASAKLLMKLGLVFTRALKLAGADHEVQLFTPDC